MSDFSIFLGKSDSIRKINKSPYGDFFLSNTTLLTDKSKDWIQKNQEVLVSLYKKNRSAIVLSAVVSIKNALKTQGRSFVIITADSLNEVVKNDYNFTYLKLGKGPVISSRSKNFTGKGKVVSYSNVMEHLMLSGIITMKKRGEKGKGSIFRVECNRKSEDLEKKEMEELLQVYGKNPDSKEVNVDEMEDVLLKFRGFLQKKLQVLSSDSKNSDSFSISAEVLRAFDFKFLNEFSEKSLTGEVVNDQFDGGEASE